MGDRVARLRAILEGGTSPRRPPVGPTVTMRAGHRPGSPAEVAASLGGSCCETTLGSCVVVERWYGPDTRHGSVAVSEGDPAGDVDHVPALGGSTWGESSATQHTASGGPLVFLDLETTGLSGGAGTHAFVVGCGAFEAGGFRTRQVVLTSFAGERALLSVIAEWLGPAAAIVSFNGKTFDLPVIETRWLFHRIPPPILGSLHLDMLHTARRLWRTRLPVADPPAPARLGPSDVSGVAPVRAARVSGASAAGSARSCSLVTLERELLGMVRRGDVPGFEIPGIYFEYLRTGDAGPLEPILEHNRLDLLSLALLTGRAARLVRGGADVAGDAGECLGLGSLYERQGQRAHAARCYARAAGLELLPEGGGAPGTGGLRRSTGFRGASTTLRVEALRRLARHLRRERRQAEAAVVWQEILAQGSTPLAVELEATEALAIHHEHRAKDLLAARRFARRILTTAGASTAVQHRLSRLDRKLARASTRDGLLG